MKTSIIKNISAKNFWLKLNKSEKYACMIWSRSRAGWKKLIAFNPVDTYSFKIGEGQHTLQNFIEKNRKNLIVGYVSFDFGYSLHNIQSNAQDELELPDLYFLAYTNYIEFENKQATIYYSDNAYLKKITEIKSRTNPNIEKGEISNFQTEISQTNYKKNFEKIVNYIKAGDIYQVNYTHRMTAETNMPDRNLFLHFLKKNPVDFATYLESDEFSVCSLSPERFIKIEGKDILSQPIKGTIKRGENLEEDNRNRIELLASEKEKAELFMIVDLIRNDLGKICEIGSVNVLKKRAIQKLPKVFHTYSKINGKLKGNINSIDALLSMFPGGSITGCPKKRAIEIIDEIELLRRGIYTGSIGYILPNRDAEFNIAIRTIVQKQKKLYLGVGGGITIESKLENEFEETLAKAQSFLKN
jgi:para-aminobenzoate synthetase component I